MTALLLAAALAADPVVPADLILHNAKVWTGNPVMPEAEAVAVWQGKILAVGTDADVKKLAGSKTELIDAGGKRAVPGFTDSHLHLLGGGLQLSRVELKDCADEAEFGKRIKAFDDKTPSERWMLGGNWDHERAFGGKMPTAATLDKLVKNRPVFLRRYDGHMGLANSMALKLAGITADTKDPPGGVIGRAADGKTPDGILKDNAMELVTKLLPEPDEEEITEAVKAAAKACAEHGITSAQDMDGSTPETRRLLFKVLQRLAKKGELPVRVDLRWPIALHKDLAAVGVEANYGGWVRVGGVKGFMDGSLGSSTAKMFEPYASDAKTTGVFVTQPDDMLALVKSADKARLSVAIHAIGDEANGKLLDLFAATAKANGDRDRRFRVEHAQHLRPDDIKRFKAFGVVASMQPFHVVEDAVWAEGRIGAKRCASSYAYRDLLDGGAVLAFGSDWPVATLNVMAGIDAAVNRRPLDGKHPEGWFPKQRITAAEALAAYTRGGAWAAFQDAERGTLTAGKVADFVLLSRDVLADGERDKITDSRVTLTVCGGKVVFR